MMEKRNENVKGRRKNKLEVKKNDAKEKNMKRTAGEWEIRGKRKALKER